MALGDPEHEDKINTRLNPREKVKIRFVSRLPLETIAFGKSIFFRFFIMFNFNDLIIVLAINK